MKKDFISILDLTAGDMKDIFALAMRLKKDPFMKNDALKNKIVGMIFEKPSNRTRVSFEVGIKQLGGDSVYLGQDDIRFGKREPVKDIARVLSRYMQMVVLRVFSHKDIEEFAQYATVPVINGLSDMAHPCQALSDIFTISEKLGDVKGRSLAFVGDANNVLNSLVYCTALVSMNIFIATPGAYKPDERFIKKAKEIASSTGAKIEVTNDPKAAVKTADVIYTDVWVSMGQEAEKKERMNAFRGFQLNADLIGAAKKDALIMHCLPAHRNEEITDDVIEGKNSIVFDQAENRLHVQKAVMVKLVEQEKK